MTDVKKGNVRLIRSEHEARELYKPTPPGMNNKIGLEVEMPLWRRGKKKPDIPTAKEMLAMQEELRARGFDAQLEASGVLEYASAPVAIKDVAKLINRARQDIAVFEETAKQHGYSRAPYCIVPTTTLQDALDNKVPRERLETALAVLNDIYPPGSARIPLITTGVQANFSPRSLDELFNMTRRGYALTPLLIAAMNSSSGYIENEPERREQHLRSIFYEAHKEAGGISRAFLVSKDAESFIRNHVKEVMDVPMYFAYANDGSLIRSTKGDILTFRKLMERGLNTLSNYELAETFLYNDIKITNIRGKDGDVAGKRVEVRAADSGIHQPFSTLLLTAALIPDGPTADKLDALLKDYGFTGNPVADAPLLLAAHEAAVEHHGHFMDVPFGTGQLRDFAADVASLLVEHYGHDKTVAADVSKLVEILLTGECDAKRHAETYKSLQDVTQALQKTPVRQAPRHPAGQTGPKAA